MGGSCFYFSRPCVFWEGITRVDSLSAKLDWITLLYLIYCHSLKNDLKLNIYDLSFYMVHILYLYIYKHSLILISAFSLEHHIPQRYYANMFLKAIQDGRRQIDWKIGKAHPIQECVDWRPGEQLRPLPRPSTRTLQPRTRQVASRCPAYARLLKQVRSVR